MNRVKFLAALRKQYGYDGPATVEAVEKFLADNNIVEFEGLPEGKTWKDVWESKAALTLADQKEADCVVNCTLEVDSERVKALEAEIERRDAEAAKVKTYAGATARAAAHDGDARWTGKGQRRLMDRKAYAHRVSQGKAVPERKRPIFDDPEKAEVFGAWLRKTLSVTGHVDYPGRADDEDILRKSLITSNNTLGGVLIPELFSQAFIDLKEDRGAFRGLVGTTPMMNDTLSFRRRTSGLTVYAPGEATAGTTSDPTLDMVTMTATKLMTLTTVSSELMHDAELSVSDWVGREIAYAFADKEDLIGFRGDGTSTYYTYTGFCGPGDTANSGGKFKQLAEGAGGTWTTDSHKEYAAGVKNASSKTWASITMSDLEIVYANLPEYAERSGPAWVCHKQFDSRVILRLQLAQGGATAAEAMQVGGGRSLFGWPVKHSQVMPKTTTIGSVIPLLFGVFPQAAKLGEVTGGSSIAMSTERGFDSDVIYIRGIERVGFLVHDVGNATTTAADLVPGPVVAMATPN